MCFHPTPFHKDSASDPRLREGHVCMSSFFAVVADCKMQVLSLGVYKNSHTHNMFKSCVCVQSLQRLPRKLEGLAFCPKHINNHQ